MKWLSAVAVSLLTITVAGRAIVQASWPGTIICAQGSLTGGERTTTTPARTPLVWSIESCAGTEPAKVASARWGMALYFDAGAMVFASSARQFSTQGPRTGSTTGFVDGGLAYGTRGDVRAVCLITGVLTRVACVRVDAAGAAATIMVQSLPISDPLVVRAVEVIGTGGPEPECAACV